MKLDLWVGPLRGACKKYSREEKPHIPQRIYIQMRIQGAYLLQIVSPSAFPLESWNTLLNLRKGKKSSKMEI